MKTGEGWVMGVIRMWLRRETAALHDAVDRIADGMDPSTEAGARTLCAFMHRGTYSVERALHQSGAGNVLPEWPARRRAALLRREAAVPQPGWPTPVAPDFRNAAELWGGLYVMEGSRLGARYLAHRNPRLAEHPFFAAAHDKFWPIFLERLEASNVLWRDGIDLLGGAEKAFAAFLGGEHHAGVVPPVPDQIKMQSQTVAAQERF